MALKAAPEEYSSGGLPLEVVAKEGFLPGCSTDKASGYELVNYRIPTYKVVEVFHENQGWQVRKVWMKNIF